MVKGIKITAMKKKLMKKTKSYLEEHLSKTLQLTGLS